MSIHWHDDEYEWCPCDEAPGAEIPTIWNDPDNNADAQQSGGVLLQGMGAEEFATHLRECNPADAYLIAENGVSADDMVSTMLAAGWTYGGVEYVAGKRIRTLVAPTSACPHGYLIGEHCGVCGSGVRG
jgi:hypothetical protein